jgi:hypothetical protein
MKRKKEIELKELWLEIPFINIELPDIEIELPDIEIELPDIEIDFPLPFLDLSEPPIKEIPANKRIKRNERDRNKQKRN